MERDLDDLTEKMVNSFKGHDTEDENNNNSKTDFGELILELLKVLNHEFEVESVLLKVS